jgi:hypothetical protein
MRTSRRRPNPQRCFLSAISLADKRAASEIAVAGCGATGTQRTNRSSSGSAEIGTLLNELFRACESLSADERHKVGIELLDLARKLLG